MSSKPEMAAESLPNFKVTIIGDSFVGKTSLFSLYHNKRVSQQNFPTLGIDYFIHSQPLLPKATLKLSDASPLPPDPSKRPKTGQTPQGTPPCVKLVVFDTAGQERYRSQSRNWLKLSHCVVVVYSVADRKSFDNVTRWVEEVKNAVDDFEMILIGNKADLEEKREVKAEEGRGLADRFNCEFYETTIFEEKNVPGVTKIEHVFARLAWRLFEKYGGKVKSDAEEGFKLARAEEKQGCMC